MAIKGFMPSRSLPGVRERLVFWGLISTRVMCSPYTLYDWDLAMTQAVNLVGRVGLFVFSW